MNQIQYDILEFTINNKAELLKEINNSSQAYSKYKNLFDNLPELFENLLIDYKLRILRTLVFEHFNCDFNDVCDAIHENNIEMILKEEYENGKET